MDGWIDGRKGADREGQRQPCLSLLMEVAELSRQSGAETCSEAFVICFLKVPLACLGRMAAAVQPKGLGNSQNTFYNTFGTSCRPRLYIYASFVVDIYVSGEVYKK